MKKFSFLLSLLTYTVSHAFVIGTNTEFPPFSYIEEGQIVGFDIDVAKEVAKRMDETITWKDMPFDALIPELSLARVDFVAAGLTISDERAKRVLFTQSYSVDDPLVIFTLNPEWKTLEDLKGKPILVVEGFTADALVSSIDGLEVTRLSTQPDAFMAMKAKRAEAFITAATTVQAFAETQKNLTFYAYPIPDTSETCAMAFPKQSVELHAKVQAVLDGMEKDGTLTAIRSKWKLQ